MKISEAVKALRALQREHGDIEVLLSQLTDEPFGVLNSVDTSTFSDNSHFVILGHKP